MANPDLKNSKALLEQATAMTGAARSENETLRKQAVSLAASMSMMTNVINQNTETLTDNGVSTTTINNIQNSDLESLTRKLFDRNEKLSNKDGEALTAIAKEITGITKDLDVNLTVTVESLIRQFSEMATNTHLTEQQQVSSTKELIGVLTRNSAASEIDLSTLIAITQQASVSETDRKTIEKIAKTSTSLSKKESKVVEGTLSELSSRFESLQLTNEEMLRIQNKNDLSKALKERANDVSIGNSALLNEATGTALELVGIGGPLGNMLSSAITDKVVQGTNFLGKQLAARLLELGATETVISKVASVKAKLQNARDHVLDSLLFRKRTTENKKRDAKSESVYNETETALFEERSANNAHIEKSSIRTTKLRDSFRNKLAIIRDKIQAKRIGKAVAKQGSKNRLIVPGLLGKMIGRVTAVLSPIAGAISSVGSSLLRGAGVLSKAIMPAAAVAAAGAAGYAVGTVINKGIDSVTQMVTGGENKTLGGAVYDFFNKGAKEKQQKQDVELKLLYAKNHPNAAATPGQKADGTVTAAGNISNVTNTTRGLTLPATSLGAAVVNTNQMVIPREGSIARAGSYTLGNSPTPAQAAVDVSASRTASTARQTEKLTKQNNTFFQPKPAPAPVVNIAPTPIAAPIKDKQVSDNKTSLDDVGLLVLQRTIG